MDAKLSNHSNSMNSLL